MNTRSTTHYVKPRVNVYESPESVTLEAELPGVSREGAEIEVRDGHLVLQAERSPRDREGDLRIRERSNSKYYRAFQLGDGIDTGDVSASMKDGVLVVTLPKAERVKTRVVAVN